METRIDHEKVADVLRQHAGRWVVILPGEDIVRAHSRVNNWRPGVNSKRPKAYNDRFEFRVKSNGYATYRGDIQARYEPATFPIDPDACYGGAATTGASGS